MSDESSPPTIIRDSDPGHSETIVSKDNAEVALLRRGTATARDLAQAIVTAKLTLSADTAKQLAFASDFDAEIVQKVSAGFKTEKTSLRTLLDGTDVKRTEEIASQLGGAVVAKVTAELMLSEGSISLNEFRWVTEGAPPAFKFLPAVASHRASKNTDSSREPDQITEANVLAEYGVSWTEYQTYLADTKRYRDLTINDRNNLVPLDPARVKKTARAHAPTKARRGVVNVVHPDGTKYDQPRRIPEGTTVTPKLRPARGEQQLPANFREAYSETYTTDKGATLKRLKPSVARAIAATEQDWKAPIVGDMFSSQRAAMYAARLGDQWDSRDTEKVFLTKIFALAASDKRAAEAQRKSEVKQPPVDEKARKGMNIQDMQETVRTAHRAAHASRAASSNLSVSTPSVWLGSAEELGVLLAGTVLAVTTFLDTGVADAFLTQIHEHEAKNKNRSTALTAIETRISTVDPNASIPSRDYSGG